MKNRLFKNDLYDKIRHNHLYNEEEKSMKRKKVCALLCVAALSTATITPAMAADNTADVQTATESTVVSEEQADVADASHGGCR